MKTKRLSSCVMIVTIFWLADFAIADNLLQGSNKSMEASGSGMPNFCSGCVFDGDPNTFFEMAGSSSIVFSGIQVRATITFPEPANVDAMLARIVVEAANDVASNRSISGYFQIQYRHDGTNFQTLHRESFGPIDGDVPQSVSFDGTLSGLDLQDVIAVRLVGRSAMGGTGIGAASFRVRMYEFGATGNYVPEPPTLGIASLAAFSSFGFFCRRPRHDSTYALC